MGGGGKAEVTAKEYVGFFLKWWNSLKIDYGDGCTTQTFEL